MPDAPGLELIRGEIERDHPGAVLDTSFDRGQAALNVDPAQILSVLTWLRDAPAHRYRFLSSLHAADYLPSQPRFGIHYELLNRDRVERLRVKTMLGDAPPAGGVVAGVPRGAEDAQHPSTVGDAATTGPAGPALPEIDSCVSLFPTANFQEREVFDFFGIVFRGHPDLTRILLPDDYVGWPQRRDFPVGGEPVIFTYNERAHG
ncbi:MAG TPA: NADH-quinone oxidoreductase subunit C [Solirubrobacterales bacterium]|nr:NADH-quinone oxidoreductase subunit C [Solirubrobacterales bacterium]